VSKIEWTEKTWNPIVGCSVVSPGCTNCYAMRMAARLERMGLERYRGLTKPSKAGPVWTGEMRLVDEALTEPLRRKKPTTWFVNSMSDLFHEGVSDWDRLLVFAVMGLTHRATAADANGVGINHRPIHTYQVLTKRLEVMRRFVTALHGLAKIGFGEFLDSDFARASQAASKAAGHPFWMNAPCSTWQWVADGCPGLWLGVSAEDQRRADERVPDLLDTPAAVRFVSAEPLLGPIDFSAWLEAAGLNTTLGLSNPGLDWLIVGGESGHGARLMQEGWALDIVEQCRTASVACFVKQLSGPKGRAIKDMAAFPASLRVREMPHAAQASNVGEKP